MFRKALVAAVAAGCLVGGVAGTAEAKTTLKMATLAPPQSPWGKVFKEWSKRIKQKTKGEVELDWLWNGTGGPERAVVEKIRAGQYAGAAVTAIGLSDIYKPVIALQLPGVFSNWAALDAARERVSGDFVGALTSRGVRLLGWGDIGIARVFSKGFVVSGPDSLKGKKPGVIEGDINVLKMYEVIGGVSPVVGSVTDFLPKLNSGAIDVMNTPSLAAEQLQWASKLTNVNTLQTYFGVGALIMSEPVVAALPADQREIVIKQGQKAATILTKRIREHDEKAYERIGKKMTVTVPTDAEKAAWQSVFKQTCERVKTVVPAEFLAKIGAC